jgi:hypothetical protein
MRVSKEMNRSCKLDTIWRAVLHRTWGAWLQGEPRAVNALKLYGSIVRGEYKFRRQIYDRIAQNPLPSYFTSCVDADVSFDKETWNFRAHYIGSVRAAYTKLLNGRVVRHLYPASDLRRVPEDISEFGPNEKVEIDGFTIGEYVEVQYSMSRPAEFAWYFGKILRTPAEIGKQFVEVKLYYRRNISVYVGPGRKVRARDNGPKNYRNAQAGGIRRIDEVELKRRFQRILMRSIILKPEWGRDGMSLMREDALFTEMALEFYYNHEDPRVLRLRDRMFQSQQAFREEVSLGFDDWVRFFH